MQPAVLGAYAAGTLKPRFRPLQDLGLPLHVLILSAATSSATFALSPDGVESHFAVNYLAQAALAQALLPLMAASTASDPVGGDAAAAAAVAALEGRDGEMLHGTRRKDNVFCSLHLDVHTKL